MRYIILETWPSLSEAYIVPACNPEDPEENDLEENAIFDSKEDAQQFAEEFCQNGIVIAVDRLPEFEDDANLSMEEWDTMEEFFTDEG